MNYAKIEDEEIVKTGPRPRWFGDDGQPVTDEVLATMGYLPVVNVPPPHDPLLQRAAINPQRDWAIETHRVVATYTVQDIPIEELRESMKEEVTAMRWEVMTGGITLPGGVLVGTDIDDQNRITSVVANAELAGLTDADEVDFKAMSGWVRITIAEVKAIAGMIGQHVQACYSVERAHHEAIDALETREQIVAYDPGTDWPIDVEGI